MNNQLFPFSLLFFSLLLFTLLPCSAQVEKIPPPQSMQKESPMKKKRPMFTVGGGMGFQFGAYNAINVAPQGGVYATPWLVALVNGQYSYLWHKDLGTSHIWGLGAALQPIIIKKIVVHVGYEFTQYNFKWAGQSSKEPDNFHFLVLGGGYKQYMSKRVYFQALILFNIPLIEPSIPNYNHNYYPFFRIGVGVDI